MLGGWAAPARASLVDGLVRQLVRPDVDARAALVTLMDARGALYQLRDLAATEPDSRERFQARRDLPALAKRLREVGTAAPVLAALAGGGDREATVSALYGGSGGGAATADAVYAAIGNVVTISGRTIRPEAQASPAAAEAAIQHIDELLAILPPSKLSLAAGRFNQSSRSFKLLPIPETSPIMFITAADLADTLRPPCAA
ncbi:hypothetical protein WJX81_008488 [Elliptochloris bilobata]|uniref:Uncharacterized protein n=1 Tax=Elliptochloris bilobata TaxID=381761 RepID=A0AAW1SC22_9CHLO